MGIKWLALLFEELGWTYPYTTLKRRLGLLTKKEKERCVKLYGQALSSHSYDKAIEKLDQMEQIISIRAEIKNDKWP